MQETGKKHKREQTHYSMRISCKLCGEIHDVFCCFKPRDSAQLEYECCNKKMRTSFVASGFWTLSTSETKPSSTECYAVES